MPPAIETTPDFNEWLLLVSVTLAVYLALVGFAQILRRARNLQFGKSYHVFAVLSAFLVAFKVSHWNPRWHDEGLLDLEALVTLSATIPLITVLNRALWTRILPDGRRMDAPRLLADTTGLLVFCGMCLMVLGVFYQIALPTSILAGSGVLAFILGFAMQDLLGNIFAGFALFASKPFKVGDWLLVDGHHARVLEVTWRSTRLMTNDEIVLEVPNNDLVKRPILNFHQPTPRHALRATIGLHYNVPPARAQAVLIQAASTVPGVCADPPVEIYVKEFAASSVVYEIKFWIEDHQLINRITSNVLAHCWYAVRRAGMEIPFPIITLHRPTPADAVATSRVIAASALRDNAIFSFLSEAQINELVQFSPLALFAKSEPLIEQGMDGGSMFLLVRGRVEVRVAREGTTRVVTTLGPGDCVGEISMLTGEKRSATVAASDEVEAVEITHAGFARFVKHNPEVLNRLGELLVKRQQANVEHAAGTAGAAPARETREGVVRRLRSFFELGE